jgi:arsenite-transporting ATPase
VGPRMLDRLAGELFGEAGAAGSPAPEAVLHTELAHELESRDGVARLRIPLPFGEKGEVSLKKVGAELIVSVGPRKRTIILPAGLARRRPAAARLADGSLEISFENTADGNDERPRTPAAVR